MKHCDEIRIESSHGQLSREPFRVFGDLDGEDVQEEDSDVEMLGRMALGDERAMRVFCEGQLIADRIDTDAGSWAVFVYVNRDSETEANCVSEAIAREPGPERLLEFSCAKQCIDDCLARQSPEESGEYALSRKCFAPRVRLRTDAHGEGA
ncbi:MAG: hypothetical protein HY017_19590 [Betaproteobacteria bacterium]|nr:hypothetical protein [Betaproteobacteria bacterium]